MSLVTQSTRDWRAHVLDDSLGLEGRTVVDECGDDRIQYRPNRRNLGLCDNLNLAFHPQTQGGARYAMILEDDNWLYPGCLEECESAFVRHGTSVVMFNQEIWNQDDPVSLDARPSGMTTRGDWISDGPVNLLHLRAMLFYHEGVSNGGLAWQTNYGIDLTVNRLIQNSWLQERVRTLRVPDRLCFLSRPLAAFTLFSGRGPDGRSSDRSLREFHTGTQALHRHLLRRHGRTITDAAMACAIDHGRRYALDQALLKALCPWHIPATLSVGAVLGFGKLAIQQLLSTSPVLRRAIKGADSLR